MSILTILVLICLMVFAFWANNNYAPQPLRQIINVVLVILVVLWVLAVVGVLPLPSLNTTIR